MPAPASASCKTFTDKVLALGKKMRLKGTPNLIFANGIRAPGFLSVEELEKHLNEAGMK
jgi:thiol:disulfide interchange protein DsbC